MNLIFSLTRPWLLIMVILLHYRVFNDDLLINFWGGGFSCYTAVYMSTMQNCCSIIFLNEWLFPV